MTDNKTLVQKGDYSQIELNRVNFPTTGSIEAQCKAELEEGQILSNGMVVEIDKAKEVVRPTKGFSAGAGGEGAPAAVKEFVYGVNYSSEHIYDDRTPGLRNYANNLTDDFLPRIGILAVGDIYTTNAIAIESLEDAKLAPLKDKTGSVTLVPSDTVPGYLEPGEGKLPLFKAVKITTMPDGQPALKVQVIKVD